MGLLQAVPQMNIMQQQDVRTCQSIWQRIVKEKNCERLSMITNAHLDEMLI